MYRSGGTGEDLIPAVLKFCGFTISKSIKLDIPSNSQLSLSAEEFTNHLNNTFAPFQSYDQLVITVEKFGQLHVVAAFRELRTDEFYIIDNNMPPNRLCMSRLFRTAGASVKVTPIELPPSLHIQITADSYCVPNLTEPHAFQTYLEKLNDEDIRSSILLAASNARSKQHRVFDLGICWIDFQESAESLFISKLIKNRLFLNSDAENNTVLMMGDTFIASFAFYLDEHEDDNAREVHYICAVFSVIIPINFALSRPSIQQLTNKFSVSVFDPARADDIKQSSTNYKEQWTKLLNLINQLAPIDLNINHPVKPCQYNDKEDTFCQTWTLNYLLQRVQGNSHDQVIQFYNNLTIPRVEFILQFAQLLIKAF
jgi:hypothetical protein